jgi:ABC-type nitrate/sulfonate/bicarbonate transport system ATPase subunit
VNRAAPPKIEVLRVTKQFGGTAAQPVLRDIDLACAENEFVCLLGPSGCGKTTLLNIIAGLLLPTSGEVRVDGDRVTGPGRGKGMVFQQNALFPWLSARGNRVRRARSTPRQGRPPRRRRLLELVGLREFAGRYPGQLSGGMRSAWRSRARSRSTRRSC